MWARARASSGGFGSSGRAAYPPLRAPPPPRQGFTISLLVAAGIIHDTRLYSADQLASGLQDFLVCIEMFLAAVAHKFAFPYQVRRCYNCPPSRRALTHARPAHRTLARARTSKRT